MAARSVHRRRSRRASSWAGGVVVAAEGAEAEGRLSRSSFSLGFFPFQSPFQFRSDSPIFIFLSRFYEKRSHSPIACAVAPAAATDGPFSFHVSGWANRPDLLLPGRLARE